MRDYRKVVLMTPVRGNQTHTLYTVGVLMSNGLHGGWMPIAGQSDIYVARNTLINQFMSLKQYDTVIFIDSDIGFTRDNLKDLIDSPEAFVSGLYTDKMQPPTPFCRDENGQQVPLCDIPKQGMIRAAFVPGGFLKVERQVLDAIVEKGLVPSYGGGKFHQFYNGSIEFDNLLSEDYSFCTLVRKAGYQPWINCGIRLNHDGRTLDPQPPTPQPEVQQISTASAEVKVNE
jgi:hypothetical protein